MEKNLEGRVALVTGAGRGIGLAIAQRLAGAGARVALADLDEREADSAAESLRKDGLEAISTQADVSRESDVRAMVARTLHEWGQIDVLVNNAGIAGRAAYLWDLEEEDWRRVLDTDLTSVFFCCREAIRPMRERKSGAIVNVASISGKEGNPRMIPYSVAKAGVICFTKALAKEVATEGIRVNCVSPAVIQTSILEQLTPEAVKYMVDKIPMGRVGQPEEVASVVHFLASDDAGFVTGQCYDISGGRATY